MQPGIIIIEPTPYTRALAYMYGTHTGIHYHTHTHTDKSLKCTEGEEKSKLEARRRICSGNKNQKCNDAWLVYINFLHSMYYTLHIYCTIYVYGCISTYVCASVCVYIVLCSRGVYYRFCTRARAGHCWVFGENKQLVWIKRLGL